MSQVFRKHLSIPWLINTVYHHFSKVQDPRVFNRGTKTRISDHLMTGLAIFGLKCPFLLDYDRKRKDHAIVHNLRELYHVANPPSDNLPKRAIRRGGS